MHTDLPHDPGAFAGGADGDEQSVKAGFWPKIRSALGKVPFAEDVVAAYYCALDRRTPAAAKAVLFSAIAYFIAPADAIPDFIVGLGFTDDAAVLMAAISAIRPYLLPEHQLRARGFLGGQGRQNNESG